MSDNGKPSIEEPTIVAPNDEPEGKVPERTIVLARTLHPEELPIVPLMGQPMFPRITVPMNIDSLPLMNMLRDMVERKQRFIGMVLRKGPPSPSEAEHPRPPRLDELHSIGVAAEIREISKLSKGDEIVLFISTLERIRLVSEIRTEPYLVARVEYQYETEMSGNTELKAYSIAVVKAIKELIGLNPLHKEEFGLLMERSDLSEPGRIADVAAALTTAEPAEKQQILETLSIRERLRKVLVLLQKEINISQIQARIAKQIDERMSRQQREFFLREQLKTIKKELGLEKEGKDAEIDRIEERLKTLKLTDEADERIKEEIAKLRVIEPMSPEFAVSRNYLDWLTLLPWGVYTDDTKDIAKAAKILDQDHYGLQDVKERILEFLSVGILKGRVAGTILCFVGPPGVGKTSIGRSIARSIGRNFYRFSVGGMRDEAEIKGHRRTYIGAMPGKMVQVLKSCKSANPVIMLDEIDKIGASYHGDPASALLEVLDPEQNRDFLDHYLDVRFDLSNVFFICTANQLDTIPRPMLDRMEIIHIAGYIHAEKLAIARRYLVPKQREANGLKTDQITFSQAALTDIIDGYAREPGVRGLELQIGKIMRKAARKFVDGRTEPVRVEVKDVSEWLGNRKHDDEKVAAPSVGVVTGLAWTSMGGDTLPVEAINVTEGKAGFKHTGQLGDVMVESSELAYTYVRSLLAPDPKAAKFFTENTIHLHVPAGATPKDGPSAGITMATALYSLAKGVPVRKRLAMTGELTLSGRVMAIGGLKEKTLAARRSNIKTLIVPDANRKDYEQLPDHLRRGLTVHFVKTFPEVVEICFR
jgi:ATP-dependent Lon protease